MALTRIKAAATEGGLTEIKVIANHPMETGQRVDPKTKEKIPAHFIQKLAIELNGKVVADIDMGVAISKDPFVGVRVKGAKAGDKVKVTWSDNKGEKGDAEATVE